MILTYSWASCEPLIMSGTTESGVQMSSAMMHRRGYSQALTGSCPELVLEGGDGLREARLLQGVILLGSPVGG